MGKTVFMFPGQGAQYIGMAKDFYDAIPECREVFEEASEASGLDIAALCFEENDKINITEYTQICMLTAEAAILRALEVKGYKADVTAGLSLGEYGALIACGALSRKDAFALVRKRGIYMQEAVPEGGAMRFRVRRKRRLRKPVKKQRALYRSQTITARDRSSLPEKKKP